MAEPRPVETRIRMTASPNSSDQVVTTRLSLGDGADGESVRRLAALADSPVPEGPVVIADVDGESVAAVGLKAGEAVADPARSSSSILTFLRLRRLEIRVVGSIWGL